MAEPEPDELRIRKALEVLHHQGSVDAKKHAAHELQVVSFGSWQCRVAIASGGGIKALASLLGSEAAVEAAETLANLAKDEQNTVMISASKAIAGLLAMARNSNIDSKEAAARAMFYLSSHASGVQAIAAAGGHDTLLCLQRDAEASANARNWAKKTKERLPAVDPVDPKVPPEEEIKEKISQAISVLKADTTDDAKQKAARVLDNLAASNVKSRESIAAAGGVPPLVALLTHGSAQSQYWAASALCIVANRDENIAMIAAAGAIPPLVAAVRNGIPAAQWTAASVLEILGRNAQTAEAITAAGGDQALKALHATKVPTAEQVRGEIQALESGKEDQESKAAEQLGNWAAISDENRGAINRAGGCEALVALVVNGSDDAKWLAARALRNLANHAEAKESILKADGISTLTLVMKHGKGKVKDAASEALNLLSLATKPNPAPVAAPVEAATEIPSGHGTRVAMFSARFDGGPVETLFRRVFQILCDRHYDVLMVAADAGQSFGDMTTEYLGRLRREKGTMLAVCTKHYGEMTASAYSSHEELKFALDYKSSVTVLPLKLEDTYPPQPPCGPEHRFDKKKLAEGYVDMVFKPSVVYLDCRNKSEREIAGEIAKHLQKHRVEASGD